MKTDWITKLLLLLIALGLWANVLSHPGAVRASSSSECSDAESVARRAYSAAEEAKEEIHKLRCGVTDFYGNVRYADGMGRSTCTTLPDMLARLKR